MRRLSLPAVLAAATVTAVSIAFPAGAQAVGARPVDVLDQPPSLGYPSAPPQYPAPAQGVIPGAAAQGVAGEPPSIARATWDVWTDRKFPGQVVDSWVHIYRYNGEILFGIPYQRPPNTEPEPLFGYPVPKP
jgi:hypothetical protein